MALSFLMGWVRGRYPRMRFDHITGTVLSVLQYLPLFMFL